MNSKVNKFIKKEFYLVSIVLMFLLLATQGIASSTLSPFVGVTISSDMNSAATMVKEEIANKNFEVVGEYNVAGDQDLKVIAFTRDDLKKVAAKYSDRGALASVLKIGIRKDKSGSVEVSLLNPNYMFNAYFRDGYDKNKDVLNKIDSDAKSILNSRVNAKLENFGGDVKISKIRNYQYKVLMPKFTNPDKLEDYDSFQEGLATIEKNIKTDKDVKLVYKIVDKENQTAVFGFALVNKKKGEAKFMPIIGERNLAAMPYEVILQGNTATMLAGKYRIALYWPELSMGTFMKIVSTPGDIEDMLEDVTEED